MNAFSGKKSFRGLLFLFFITLIYMLPAQDVGTKTAGSTTAGNSAAVATEDETAIYLDATAGTGSGTVKPASSSSSIWILLRVVLVLAIVCAGIYGVVYLLKRSTKINAGNDPYLKNVASLSLSTNKAVQVITVGSQAFLIGVTDQSISLISEINDRELIDAMNLDSDRNSPVPPGTFSSVLKAFLPKKNEDTIVPENTRNRDSSVSGESASALATTDFLKKQRERLKNGSSE